MHGNVWEWCADWYGDYPKTPETDPLGAAKGKYRILRGGSWKDGSGDARSAYRGGLSPSTKYKDMGFRVAAKAKGGLNALRRDQKFGLILVASWQARGAGVRR